MNTWARQREARVMVWEPWSVWLTLQVLPWVPLLAISLLWLAAYVTPEAISRPSGSGLLGGLTVHLTAVVVGLWMRYDRAVDRFVMGPYLHHGTLVLAAASALVTLPTVLLYHRMPERLTPEAVLRLCSTYAALGLIPFLVDLAAPPSLTLRQRTWWQITLLVVTTTFITHHSAQRLHPHRRPPHE
ncbi:MAG: hypothetical protein ACP5OY_07175 [Halothiobacillaceae bacterium]